MANLGNPLEIPYICLRTLGTGQQLGTVRQPETHIFFILGLISNSLGDFDDKSY